MVDGLFELRLPGGKRLRFLPEMWCAPALGMLGLRLQVCAGIRFLPEMWSERLHDSQ
jgi:hypothetical protein